ncbi:FUSC family protein [Actinoallomurus iriomotensis]|uniref:FUSC family protein n=1 Tax=Actinoallomurus iriomotensis TaxID=478107 RepID=A0A9W6RP69_9ACTN|nr:aromatic acid exporter family protein [Actinoallomurus iriomotensis]GLY79079.1 FUSC family protein [Actinoallomurus iriomotensis]
MVVRPVAWLRWHAGYALRSLRRALRGPSRERDLLVQSAKSAVAAALAWLVAYEVLHAPLASLAPWVALVMVHTTVYRSVVKGLQQGFAVVFGVVVATAGFALAGDRTVALIVVLLVTMPLVNLRTFGDQGIYGPLTAVLVVTSGQPSAHAMGWRLLETGLGMAVGVLVNALILPPTHLRDAHEAVTGVAEEIAGQLDRLGDGLAGEWDVNDARDWLRRSDDLRARTEDAWSAIRRGRESMRMNPRSRPGRRGEDLSAVLLPLEVVAKQTQGICRTLVDAAEEGMPDPDPGFLAVYAEMLCHGATVVRAYRRRRLDTGAPDLPAVLDAAREHSGHLHGRLRADEFRLDGWLIHGPLLIEIDRMLTGLADDQDLSYGREP